MALSYLAFDIMLLEEKARVATRKIEKRRLRDSQNAFELPEQEFHCNFRLSKELVMEIVDSIRHRITKRQPYALSPEVQVLTALLFYATGSYQRATGANSIVTVSQPSVSRIVRQVSLSINNCLLRKWIVFPMTRQDRERSKLSFANRFAGALGAIDCTHVLITAPHEHEEAYVNHHGTHSINVQAIADGNLRILDVSARWPGARHDSFIWQQSGARGAMEFHWRQGEKDTYLLGDSGYPLEPWLMTPLPGYPEDTRQYAYTKDHCAARNVVERAFGVIKSTFRAISGHRVLLYQPQIAGEIVVSCFILHNMRLAAGMTMVEDDLVLHEVSARSDASRQEPGMALDNHHGIRNAGEDVQRRIIRCKYRIERCACAGPPNFHCVGRH